MMSGFREDANSFLTRICQRLRPLAAMFLSDQVCFICFVVGHRRNITAKFWRLAPGGMLKVSYKCLQEKLATPHVINIPVKLAQWYTIDDTLDEQQTLTDPSSSLWALCSDEL